MLLHVGVTMLEWLPDCSSAQSRVWRNDGGGKEILRVAVTLIGRDEWVMVSSFPALVHSCRHPCDLHVAATNRRAELQIYRIYEMKIQSLRVTLVVAHCQVERKSLWRRTAIWDANGPVSQGPFPTRLCHQT